MDVSPALLISFIVYSLAIVSVGLYSARQRKKTTDDFVLANRELGPWAAALSASASSESGWVMLGLVGAAFNLGMSAFWIVPGIAAGYLVNWFVLADRLRIDTRKSGAATLTQYLINRFGNSRMLRIISVVIITAAMLGYVAAQMNAAGKAFDAVFHLPYWIGVLVGAAIILAYTITGGFRAICWTDIVQATFMMIALIGMPLVMLGKLGSYSAFTDRIMADAPHLLSFSGDKVGLALVAFVIGYLGIGLGYPGQPHVLSRFMAAKDSPTVKKAAYISFGWMTVVYIGAVFFGLFARAYYGQLADPEQALPLACGELLPPVLAGFVVAAIVSAICSTADSQLIVVSTTISRDVFGAKDITTDESKARLLKIDRLVLVGLGVVSVLFALTENRVIFEFVLYAWAALGAGFGPVVILGLLWKKTNRTGAIAGMLTGLVVVIVWRNIPQLKAIVYELVPAFLLSMIVVVVVSILTSKSED
ncbi:MAG: sodium/proline symporter [candidate division Zixibacteria bacterium]